MNIDHSKSIESVPVVFIVPLTENYALPSLAVSNLKESLRAKGIMSRVFYANILFFKLMGDSCAEALFDGSIGNLIFERLFASSAYKDFSQDFSGFNGDDDIPDHLRAYYERVGGVNRSISKEMYAAATARCKIFLKEATEWIVSCNPKIIAISNPYQQTNVSAALTRSVKECLPRVVSVLGGNNCEGEMGAEIADSIDIFDYVFQGEADFVFADFCLDYLDHGILPEDRLINCTAPTDLDALPIPDFSDFFEQSTLPQETLTISFESSRGCWWGHKNQCRFCGDSAVNIPYRFKSPERTLKELIFLQDHYQAVHHYLATDSIFPAAYFKDFLSLLASNGFRGEITYEIRADLTYEQVMRLRKAGISRIFPGIESLSSRLLRMLNKGTQALDNIRLLRNCRELGIMVDWLFLLGIPGDLASDYDEQTRLVPYLQHLAPPRLSPLRIQRFSPYYNDPESYGIKDIKPLNAYRQAFPATVDVDRLAYFFTASYPSESRQRPEILSHLLDLLGEWNAKWVRNEIPDLSIMPEGENQWIVQDSRDCAKAPGCMVDDKDYSVLYECRQGSLTGNISCPERINRLLDFGYLIEADGKLISLVCERKNAE